MRYRCTKENPLYGSEGQRVEHEGAYESRDLGNWREMTCADCGRKWKEELPE